MGELGPDAGKPIRHAGSEIGVPVLLVRPEDDERPPLDIVPRHESPGPAVPAVVPVVPHGEIVVRRDLGRRVVVRVPVGFPGVDMLNERLVLRHAIEEETLVPYLHHVPGEPDDSLDVVLFRLLRILEDDDVVAADVADGEEFLFPLEGGGSVHMLVHHDVVADEQRGNHGAGGNLGLLEHVRTSEQHEDDAGDDCLEIVADDPFRRIHRGRGRR